MPRELELFDGTVLEFPDDTPDEVMISAGKRETANRQAVGQGDWQGVKSRIDAREAEVFKPGLQGPVRPEDIANVRQAEARKQGEMYGQTYGKGEGGGEIFGRQFANTAGLGLPQLAEAYMPGWLGGQSALPGAEAHEFIKASDAARTSESPIAGYGGMAAGGLAQGVAVPGALPGLARFGAAGRVGSAAVTGAGLGAGQAAAESRLDPTEIAKGAGGGLAGGFIGGAAGEGIANAFARTAGQRAARAVAPSQDELANIARQKYAEATKAGVWFKPQAYDDLVNDIKTTLSNSGVDETLHPKVMATVRRLEQEVGGNSAVTLDKLDLLRRVASSAAKSKEPDEGRLASMVIGKIDDFVDGAGPDTVLFGDGQAGAKALQDARGAYAAKARSARILDAIDNAEIGTGATGSGSNIDNKLRQAAASILKNKNSVRGFSPQEIDALKQVAEGTLTRNALRLGGKAAPTGIVSGALSGGAGFGLGGPVGAAALMGGGYVSKKLADAGTKKAMESAAAMTRARAVPGATQKIAKASDPERQAIARMLMTMLGIHTGTEVARQ